MDVGTVGIIQEGRSSVFQRSDENAAVFRATPRPRMGDSMGVQHVERGWHPTVELNVWTGADGEAEWYEDDGDSLAYRDGAYAITPLSFKGGVLTVGKRSGPFCGMPKVRRVRVIRHDEKGTTVVAERDISADGATFSL